MSRPEQRIILQVTGSIAAFKAASLASLLIDAGYEVECVMSEGARHFIGESTLEGLTGRPVLGDVFERGRAHDHINLVERADLLLLYPASANHISRLRAGLADDLIGCLFLADNFRKPFWVAPAMNSIARSTGRRSSAVPKSGSSRIIASGTADIATGRRRPPSRR